MRVVDNNTQEPNLPQDHGEQEQQPSTSCRQPLQLALSFLQEYDESSVLSQHWILLPEANLALPVSDGLSRAKAAAAKRRSSGLRRCRLDRPTHRRSFDPQVSHAVDDSGSEAV